MSVNTDIRDRCDNSRALEFLKGLEDPEAKQKQKRERVCGTYWARTSDPYSVKVVL